MIDDLFGLDDTELGVALTNLLNQYAKLSSSKICFKIFDEDVQYTVKELHFLHLLNTHDGLRNIDLALKLGVTKGMISKIINELEKRDLILKKQNPSNKREISLFITDKGKSHVLAFSSKIHTDITDISMTWYGMEDENRKKMIKILTTYSELLTKLDSKN